MSCYNIRVVVVVGVVVVGVVVVGVVVVGVVVMKTVRQVSLLMIRLATVARLNSLVTCVKSAALVAISNSRVVLT